MAKIKRPSSIVNSPECDVGRKTLDYVDSIIAYYGLEDEPIRVELARCVCCGSPGCRVRHVETDMHRIECVINNACGARTGFYSTEAEAIAAWNRRA